MKNNKITNNKLSKIIWKNIIIILVFTVIFGAVGALYAKHKKHTVYESERSIMTSHSYRGANANEEVQADISLGKTYSKIIESPDVAKDARKSLPKKLRKKYDSNQINSMINATPVDQTTIIKVSAKSDSAKDSTAIVNAVTKAATEKIPQKVPNSGKVSQFSKATSSDSQSKTTPSTKKLALLGSAVGFLLGMVVSFSITTWQKLI